MLVRVVLTILPHVGYTDTTPSRMVASMLHMRRFWSK